MTAKELAGMESRLGRFLSGWLTGLGRSERRHWAKLYLRGLLLAGERKSIEPMARRLPGADVQALRQFIGQGPWAVEAIQRGLTEQVVDTLTEPEVWMIDETSFPKAGTASSSDDWLADLRPPPVGLRRLVRTARARWQVELDCRELKEELGLDHYEGRHWLGWHHHVPLVSVACAFLRTEQSRLKKDS